VLEQSLRAADDRGERIIDLVARARSELGQRRKFGGFELARLGAAGSPL
jgi:hypothetical protein